MGLGACLLPERHQGARAVSDRRCGAGGADRRDPGLKGVRADVTDP